jgi:hypothetical protein
MRAEMTLRIWKTGEHFEASKLSEQAAWRSGPRKGGEGQRPL